MFKISPAFIFYLHYALLTSGLSGTSVLLGVFIKNYSDASSAEIGILLMSFPFASIIIKPLFCSMADRYQKHQLALILSLIVLIVGYTPFIVIPFYPGFYLQHPRSSWYMLILACHVGNAGLGVAWSLGDTLSVNISMKTGTPYARMRLMGTISWGVYGYIIGQINEYPSLPKMVPGFMILHVSVIFEILFLIFWPKQDFEMFNPTDEIVQSGEKHMKKPIESKHMDSVTGRARTWSMADSTPGSLGSTLRCPAKTASVLKNFWAHEDLTTRLRELESSESLNEGELVGDKISTRQQEANGSSLVKLQSIILTQDRLEEKPNTGMQATAPLPVAIPAGGSQLEETESSAKNDVQIVLMKLILRHDKRLIKYLCFYTLFGFFMASTNFVYLSLPDVCIERQCNFSEMAGYMLLIQAAVETFIFMVIPLFTPHITRAYLITFGFVIVVLRFLFYVIFYSNQSIPYYWIFIGECGHGISYGVFCCLLADIALSFANESKLFIPEIRKLGLISAIKAGNEAQVEEEEKGIKNSLRATMQSLFSGFQDGIGIGTGSLLCGQVANAYSYRELWYLLLGIAVASLVAQITIELTKCRMSDYYSPKPGKKAFEIMAFERQEKELQKRLQLERQNNKSKKGQQTCDLKV